MQRRSDRLTTGQAMLLAVLGMVLVVLVGYVDYLTSDYSLLIFYALPVGFNAWFLGDGGAVVLSLASGCARFISDFYSYSPSDFRYWNSVEDTFFLLAIGLVLSSVRRVLEEEGRGRTATKLE